MKAERKKTIGGALATACLLAVTSVAACSGTEHPPTGDPGSSGGPGPYTPAGEAGTGADASPRTDLCEDLAPGGELLPSMTLPGEPPPPLGGALSPGTYDLTSLYLYGGSNGDTEDPDASLPPRPPSESAQATLVVTADTIEIARGAGAADDGGFADATISYGWIRVDGTDLVVDELCPTRQTSRIPYSAVGDAIALYTATNRREVYSLRP